MNLLNAGVDSAKHDIQELVEGLQRERGQALAGLRDLQLALRLLAQAEAQRLARRDPVDARLAPLARLDSRTRERIALIDTEIDVASIRVPPVRKTEALLHGRIADESLRAVGGVTAVLLDAKGKPVDAVPPASVDEAGYYAFVIGPEAARLIAPDQVLNLGVQRGDAQVRPTGAKGFKLAAGRVTVQDLTLDDKALLALRLRHAGRGDDGTTVPKPQAAPPDQAAKAQPDDKARPAKGGTRPRAATPKSPKPRKG